MWKKSLLHLTNFSVVLPLGFAFSLGLATTAVAGQKQRGIEDLQLIAQAFQPPPGGANISTAGGGTRGPCLVGEKPLRSVSPKSNLGLTLSEHPTFFVYIPQTTAKEVQFSVIEEDRGEIIYETSFTTPSQPGIVSVSLPASVKSLEVGKRYNWTFQVVCSSKNEAVSDVSGSPFVQGYVERIEPSQELMAELEKAGESELANVYAQNGIWHETVINSAKQRGSNQAAWEELLNSVGLSEISKEPLVECCQAQK